MHPKSGAILTDFQKGIHAMNQKTNNTISTTKRHLTYSNRCTIEALLNEGYSMRYIAQRIDFSPSTISREISRHTITKKSYKNDCLNKSDCKKSSLCSSSCRIKKCKTCNHCKKYCPDYTQAYCSQLEEKGLCNGCHKAAYCNFEKKFYIASSANKAYKEMLHDRRCGFDLTYHELEAINYQVTPLIRKGQSPYHIKQSLGEALPISESTLRRMIADNQLDARQIDLREAVRRKPRKKHRISESLSSPQKLGHTYSDYLSYIQDNDVNVIEMDCVEGVKEDNCAILTLHFVTFHMQLYYIMPEHTAKCVVQTLDMIEQSIGSEMFASLFEILLTDNGHEFWNLKEMERSITSGKRTRVFFCDANRSDQKGACENNHKLLRCIIPKGTSIDHLMQSDVVKITNHINSYCRKSLYGHSPYALARNVIPEDFFVLLGLETIEPGEVILKPSLLKNI